MILKLYDIGLLHVDFYDINDKDLIVLQRVYCRYYSETEKWIDLIGIHPIN